MQRNRLISYATPSRRTQYLQETYMHTMHTPIHTISLLSRKQDSLTVLPFTTARPDVIKKVHKGVITNRRSQSLIFLLTLLPSALRSLALLITLLCTLISLLLHIYSKFCIPNISSLISYTIFDKVP